ncbi:MAG: hypothetical protein Q7K42_02280 [Candidatus Diapherotrites archaeon]|nr:hypothetical protein [Candidatus Diapherotrites archaeon]
MPGKDKKNHKTKKTTVGKPAGKNTIEGLNLQKQETEKNINFWLGKIKSTSNKLQLKIAKKRLKQEQKEYKKIFQKLEQLTGNNLRLIQK